MNEVPKKLQSGFTMVELLLVMSIFAVMTALATVSLGNFQQNSQINAAVNTLVTDLKEQQVKAMVGDTQGGGDSANYGIRFSTTSYTLFRNNYGTANFTNTLPSTLTVTFASAGADLVFLKGSGEIPGYASSSAVITLTDTIDGNQKVIRLNRYGVITSAN